MIMNSIQPYRTAGTTLTFLRALLPLVLWGFVSDSAQAQAQSSAASLEARIDGLLKQMTAQEKIEQLFYKTDGNARLGIPQFTGSDGPHGIGNKAKGGPSFPCLKPTHCRNRIKPGI